MILLLPSWMGRLCNYFGPCLRAYSKTRDCFHGAILKQEWEVCWKARELDAGMVEVSGESTTVVDGVGDVVDLSMGQNEKGTWPATMPVLEVPATHSF